jgi:hypothetical protein
VVWYVVSVRVRVGEACVGCEACVWCVGCVGCAQRFLSMFVASVCKHIPLSLSICGACARSRAHLRGHALSETYTLQVLPFLAALRAFRFRVLYGNVCNDLLVPYPTAMLAGLKFFIALTLNPKPLAGLKFFRA